MKEVSFTIHGHVHRIDISELRELIQQLTRLAVESEQELEVEIKPPALNADDMLDLDSIRLFMSQFNAEPAWLRNNANKLWARIGKLSARGVLPFDVYCADCGLNVREPCTISMHYHLGEARRYVMTPETILEHGSEMLQNPTKLISQKALRHFEALMNSLQARKDGREV